MRFVFFLIIVSFLSSFKLFAQLQKKELTAVKTISPPKIDGYLDEEVWNSAYAAKDFIQMSPYNGSPAVNPTEVKVLFDDHAIYFGAIMYDPNPDSIRSYLSLRDDMADSDNIGFSVNPYNDGVISYHFIVTAAGVQVDMRSSQSGSGGFDRNWDVVWESAVKTNDKGWVCEVKIPFSALRFNPSDQRGWGLNIIRVDKRKPEQTSWNFIDSKIQGFDTQMGLLKGIEGIKTPARLSFTPYLAGYINKQTGLSKPGYSLKGGMDVKYGISDSYTLDMMLIPDFGEVQSDEEILNLTPYEVQYDEKRQFFTEGGELFSRADIFYSRRIGNKPIFHSLAYQSLKENEVVATNPIESQIINATKLSGKSKNGLSIGFLNAITSASHATIKDTLSGIERQVQTQPFTNYNVTVFDQTLKNNSFISLINTNVSMSGNRHGANVTGIQSKLANKNNEYALFFKGSVSHNRGAFYKTGGYYDIMLAKIKGNFQMGLNQILKSDNYDPNTLGYERVSNIFENELSLNYNIFDPFWHFMEWSSSLSIEHTMQYNPMEFSSIEIETETEATLRNYMKLEISNTYLPESNDFHEPRFQGLYFRRPAINTTALGLSTDDRKRLSIGTNYAYSISSEYGHTMHEIDVSAFYRFNHRFIMEYGINHLHARKDLGYSGRSGMTDTIYFSNRNQKTLENKMDLVYSFSNKATFRFTARHYWSRLQHNSFYTLDGLGNLSPDDGFSAKHLNFNLFNIDMLYSWEFAPGSTFSVVYKNVIHHRNEEVNIKFLNNFHNTLLSDQLNSLSVKFLYYLDYNYLVKK
jgi:hypothetical protein